MHILHILSSSWKWTCLILSYHQENINKLWKSFIPLSQSIIRLLKSFVKNALFAHKKGGFIVQIIYFIIWKGLYRLFHDLFAVDQNSFQKSGFTSHFQPKKVNFVHKTLFIIVCIQYVIFYTFYKRIKLFVIFPFVSFLYTFVFLITFDRTGKQKKSPKTTFSDSFLHYIF
jgi:hypothetical protein